MKLSYILLFTLAFFACGSSVNNTSVNIISNSKIRLIKSWTIQYDTLSGYSNTTSLILNESSTTVYESPNGISQLSSTAWEIAEKRGLKLSANIKSNLSNKKIILEDKGEGIIKIYRPLFLDDGRYILHIPVDVFDNEGTKIAELDIFNNCRAQNENKGIRCYPLGDIKNDEDFAIYCSNKIFDAIKH